MRMRCKHCKIAVVPVEHSNMWKTLTGNQLDYPMHCPWCAHQTMLFDTDYLEPLDGVERHWNEERQAYGYVTVASKPPKPIQITAEDMQFLARGHVLWEGNDTRP